MKMLSLCAYFIILKIYVPFRTALGILTDRSEFWCQFRKGLHGLEYKKDALNNVIIKKAATAGYVTARP